MATNDDRQKTLVSLRQIKDIGVPVMTDTGCGCCMDIANPGDLVIVNLLNTYDDKTLDHIYIDLDALERDATIRMETFKHDYKVNMHRAFLEIIQKVRAGLTADNNG